MQQQVRFSSSPSIAVIGLEGSGKTKTIQRLFKTNSRQQQQIYQQPLELSLISKKTDWTIFDISVTIQSIDEDLLRFAKELRHCDVILWVFDIIEPIHPKIHQAIQSLSQYHGNMIIGLNKIDQAPPFNWDAYLYVTSVEQAEYIQATVDRTYHELEPYLDSIASIVPFTAAYYLGLVDLLLAIIHAVPHERAIFLDTVKDLKPAKVKPYLAEYIYY